MPIRDAYTAVWTCVDQCIDDVSGCALIDGIQARGFESLIMQIGYMANDTGGTGRTRLR